MSVCLFSGAFTRDLPGFGPPGVRAEGAPFPLQRPAERSDDEKAIAGLVAAFTKAFDGGDAAAAAATFAEDALVVDEQGERIVGRAAIRAQLAASFADNPGSTITIKVDSLRFLGPDTAFEEGRTTITPAGPGAVPEITRFTVVYIKKNGQWLQSAVRDELSQDLGPHDRLKELEWLVGDWINESQDAIVSTSCKWTADGNFLIRDFTMKTHGQPVLSGSQRIGWDAVKHQFKTWIFDSEGGFGEGYWTRDGDRWLIKADGVRQDGNPRRPQISSPGWARIESVGNRSTAPSVVPQSRASTNSPWCASHPKPASSTVIFAGELVSSFRIRFMTRIRSKLVLVTALVILAIRLNLCRPRWWWRRRRRPEEAVAVIAVLAEVVGRVDRPRSASHASRRVSREAVRDNSNAGCRRRRHRVCQQEPEPVPSTRAPPPRARAIPTATRTAYPDAVPRALALDMPTKTRIPIPTLWCRGRSGVCQS